VLVRCFAVSYHSARFSYGAERSCTVFGTALHGAVLSSYGYRTELGPIADPCVVRSMFVVETYATKGAPHTGVFPAGGAGDGALERRKGVDT
jgi:hypothetical protein